jgi:hypothetical protein
MLAASLCNIQIPWGGWRDSGPSGAGGKVEQDIIDRIMRLGKAKKARRREEAVAAISEAKAELPEVLGQLGGLLGGRVEYQAPVVADDAGIEDLYRALVRWEFIFIAILRLIEQDEDDIEAILLAIA